MRIFSVFLFLTISVFTFSQEETPFYKEVSAQFVSHYNSGNYQEIFELFSKEMKNFLPLEKTNSFLAGLKLQAGQIIGRSFDSYENGTYASYKTEFENTTLSLNISLDGNGLINGLFIKPYVERSEVVLERNSTPMILPFKGEWNVFWGGDTEEQNYHVTHRAQKGAFDIIILDDSGKSYNSSGTSNDDYYVFGQELIAPCDGEVVLVVDGIKDNVPGKMNPIYIPGNTVVIKTGAKEYLFFAHFKQHSIAVKQGQQVKQGDLLGLCGNSGNSSEPHLHFHIQNTEDMTDATGAKCYFDKIWVNGELKEDYSPIKGERIRN